jgi:hypothetical protein
METITKNYGHGDITYKIINGTAYHVNTPDAVVNILERYRQGYRGEKTRIRLFYGDNETGRDWNEEHNVIGYIGRSTGSIKIPLLINNNRSLGGPGLLDHCIVKITVDKKTIYQHPKYNNGEFTVKPCTEKNLLNMGYTHMVYRNGENVANFKNEARANNYIQFMQGLRNAI